jgi:hypothetical protein
MKNTKSRNSASQSQADTKQIIRVCVLQPLGGECYAEAGEGQLVASGGKVRMKCS